MEEDRLLKVGEVVGRLGLSRSKVFSLLANGDIPSLTIGRSRRVSRSALARFVEQREADSRPTDITMKAAPEVEPGTADEGGTYDAAPSD
jgi:excisionase family DNA binding protein